MADLSKEQINWYNKMYVFMKPMHCDEVERRIDEALKDCDIENGIFIFQLCSRGRNSCVFDQVLQQFCLVRSKRTCSSLNRRSSRKAIGIGNMMLIVKAILKTGSFMPMNQIHYQYEGMFGATEKEAQRNIKSTIGFVCEIVGCQRHSLGIYADTTGRIIGNIILYTPGSVVDCSSNTISGSIIPPDVEFLSRIERKGDVRCIVVVEKRTLFVELNIVHFCQTYHCILITGTGQPDVATRILLRKLQDELCVPVYAFMDPNPFGAQIYCTYRYGSHSKSDDNLFLRIVNLNWIGLFLQRYRSRKKAFQPLTPKDISIIRSLLEWQPILHDPNLRAELEFMLDEGAKSDMHKLLTIPEIVQYIRANVPEFWELQQDA